MVTKQKAQGRLLVTCFLALLGLLMRGGFVMAASSSEEALRARVEQCYSAIQQGDWAKVEKYLTKDSKPIFRSQSKQQIVAYKIQSIKIDPDGRTASVVVQIPLVSAVSPRPIPVPRTTLWRLINHVWCLEIPRPNPNASQSLFDMPPKNVNPSVVPAFSKDLKFESTWCGLGNMANNGTQVARFSFKNVSGHVVTLVGFQLGCDCLTLKTQQRQYQPGESGTLEIEFDASKLGLTTQEPFTQNVVFQTEPGDAYVKLTIAALILAPSSAPPAKP